MENWIIRVNAVLKIQCIYMRIMYTYIVYIYVKNNFPKCFKMFGR